jgi:ABC-2 type transport system permease protein
MGKMWRVALHDYLRHVLRKRFLFALFSLPLVLLSIAAVGGISVLVMVDRKGAGYVDLSGITKLAAPADPDAGGLFDRARLIEFSSEEEARSHLNDGEISAYYVIAADYMTSGNVKLVSMDTPGENVQNAFSDLLRSGLMSGVDEEVARRILDGSEVSIRSLTDEREADSQNWFNLVLPIFTAVIFLVVINTSGGYLLQAVVEEKENRTMEIVVTSLSTQQLMTGKIIGNLSVGLTQMLLWAAIPMAAFFALRSRIPFLQAVRIDSQFGWLSIVTLLLAFLMVAALMAMTGATATEAREAQQVSGLFTLPLVCPLWFTSQFMLNPDGILATVLSIFPLTSPLSLPMRSAFTHIPEWQIVLSLLLLLVSALGAMWMAGRAFRLGMLRYGKRLKLAEIFRRSAA